MISLITPTQGNPIALKRTIDSVAHICNEVIVGDVCVFAEDSELIKSYPKVQSIFLQTNFIFKYGFSEMLNTLVKHASNDMVLYLNVGEVIERGENILTKIHPKYNAYYIDHGVEKHRWWRMYNKNELHWEGIIHEELFGEYRPYHKPIFRFADTEKDNNNPFKAKVYNDIKEMVYWNQLIKLIEAPNISPSTNEGWFEFAKNTYRSMKDRLAEKGMRYIAFAEGRIGDYLRLCEKDKSFLDEPFNTTSAIEFQGDPAFLGKKKSK